MTEIVGGGELGPAYQSVKDESASTNPATQVMRPPRPQKPPAGRSSTSSSGSKNGSG